MVEGNTERRLAAIVAIDVAGYSRLMGADEDSTLAALKSHRGASMTIGEQHGGRMVGTAGDGVLWEFPSITEAVNAAIEIQALINERNVGLADDRKMLFRIGINLGDVMVDDDDIYGDGVNVAARIEALASPGGICLSRAARDQVRDRMDINLEDMGEIEVKNIARPVRVFRVLPEGETAAPPSTEKTKMKWFVPAITAVVLLIAIVGGITFWWQTQPDFEPADPTKFAYKLPEKPSIAVLPFDNLTGDKKQDYLGDGLTENIIAVLATSPNLFVIARNSSFTYKGKATKVQKVAEQLGVRYVLEGSVQRDGEKSRITAELVDAVNGRHLWSKRYDRKLDNIFKLQDEIAQEILVAIQVKLTLGDTARRIWLSVGDAETYRLYMLAGRQFAIWSREGNAESERLIKAALKRSPNGVRLMAHLSATYWQRVGMGLSKDPAKDIANARELVERGLLIDEQNEHPHYMLATLDLFAGNFDSAIQHADRAIELAPNSGYALAVAGWIKAASDQPREAVEILRRAMRIEPYYPDWVPGTLAFVHMTEGKFEEARKIYEGILKSTKLHSTRIAVHRNMAALHVFAGNIETARTHIAAAIKLQPNFSVSAVKRGLPPFRNMKLSARYFAALRKAGLPETPPSAKAKKPAIAVLPFNNLSDDKDQEYFADGMTEDIITGLSKVMGLRVTSQLATLRFRRSTANPQDIAAELNVGYILAGSVRRAGTQLRITAKLVDGVSGNQLWAERFDRETKEFFAIQDEIAERVVAALSKVIKGPALNRAARTYTPDVEAYDLYIRGRATRIPPTPENLAAALKMFEQAIAIDSRFAGGYAGAAFTHILSADSTRQSDARSDNIEIALRYARKAVELDPTFGPAWGSLAEAASRKGLFDEVFDAIQNAIEAAPSDSLMRALYGRYLGLAGRPQEGIAQVKQAMHMSPDSLPMLFFLGINFRAAGDYEKAIEALVEHRTRLGGRVLPGPTTQLIAAFVQAGRMPEARAEVNKLLNVAPHYNTKIATKTHVYKNPADTKIFIDALRIAGLPE